MILIDKYHFILENHYQQCHLKKNNKKKIQKQTKQRNIISHSISYFILLCLYIMVILYYTIVRTISTVLLIREWLIWTCQMKFMSKMYHLFIVVKKCSWLTWLCLEKPLDVIMDKCYKQTNKTIYWTFCI